MLRELATATEEFDLIQFELEGLYKQDKYGVYEGQALLVSENTTLRQARELITKIKIAQKSDKSSETTSVRSHDSRRSHASRASTSSSVARLKAAAEENEMKQREAEEEKRRQQARVQHERDIAFMSANKRVTVANVRLKAIQESMLEREIDDPQELPNMDITDCQERTMAWVHSSTPKANDWLPSRVPHTPIDGHTHESPYTPKVRHTPEDGHTYESPYTPKDRHTHESPYTPQAGHTLKSLHPLGERRIPAEGYTPSGGHVPIVDSATKVIQKTSLPTVVPSELPKVDGEPPRTHYAFDYSNPPRSSSRKPVLFSTPREVYTGIPLETFATTNQQIVASLAKQSLPKCHPDVFNGDVAMFHSWKRSFKAMVKDADVAADQELNYLRSYTSGNPQQLVDNYRKRQGDNPTVTLAELWVELERRFGNAAALTQALIDRLPTAAGFGEKDCARLQKLADLCADVDCQMTYLPGLACLNYPIAIRPIIEKLPASLRSKWDKEIVRYAERYNDAYPTFREFWTTIQNQARKKNHPNVSAGSPATSSCTQNRRREDNKRRHFPQSGDEVKQAMKTKMDPDSGKVPGKEPSELSKKKHCLFHKRAGHDLTECKAFNKMAIKQREQWVKEKRLCFHCFSPHHVASTCKENVKCSICGSRRHPDLLQISTEEKTERAKEAETANEAQENINAKCTSICKGAPGGLSCSKIVLVDIYREDRPNEVHRVYAIVDDQSNASIISTELADKLNAEGPEWKYYLSTCGGAKEVRYGRRLTGLIISFINGRTSRLPTLIECDGIPQDKKEIPTPEIAREHPHLRSIAVEIPPLDKEAKIQLLIGRDAPELLKVRAFKNGPKGAPWAQKLALGWTISGQTCLDLKDGPIYVQAKRAGVVADRDIGVAFTDDLTSIDPATHVARTGVNKEAEYEIVTCPNTMNFIESFTESSDAKNTAEDVYRITQNDNDVGLSIEDRKFMEIMDKGIHKNKLGNWEMPLPFRSQNVSIPNNRNYALKRLNGLLRTFKRKPQMEKDYVEFMSKMLDKGHAVPVPDEEISPSENSGRKWYLPHFGVYHPKKPEQIRVVFDSSAEYQGKPLNQELLTGPDLMNSLAGVLIRFRREDVAAMCDVEQMFHSFHVSPEHRDFLHFLWFKENDLSKPVTEFRMTVHLFGNGPSPAVETFGLRRTVDNGEGHDPGVKEFCKEISTSTTAWCQNPLQRRS